MCVYFICTHATRRLNYNKSRIIYVCQLTFFTLVYFLYSVSAIWVDPILMDDYIEFQGRDMSDFV